MFAVARRFTKQSLFVPKKFSTVMDNAIRITFVDERVRILVEK